MSGSGLMSIADGPMPFERRVVHLTHDCRYLPVCTAVVEVQLVATRRLDAESGQADGRVEAEASGHGWRPVCRLCARRSGIGEEAAR